MKHKQAACKHLQAAFFPLRLILLQMFSFTKQGSESVLT